MKIAIWLSATAAASMILGCSSPLSETEVKEEARVATAEALKLDAAVAAIEVTSVERAASSSSWVAHYDGKILSCSATELFQLPDCRVDADIASN